MPSHTLQTPAQNTAAAVQRADALTHAKLARFDTRAPGVTLIVPRNRFNVSADGGGGGGERADLMQAFGLQPEELTEAEATQVRPVCFMVAAA